jgi:hypothetical protein
LEKVDVWFNATVVWEIKGADFQVMAFPIFSYLLFILVLSMKPMKERV